VECADARKQLKEYTLGDIPSGPAREQLENHIEGCAVCRKELLLWQDVMDRQVAIRGMQRTLPAELRERLKYRAKISEKEKQFAEAGGGKIKALAAAWASPKFRLLVQIFFLMAVMIFALFVLRGSKNLAAPAMVIGGFAVVFSIMILKRLKKK